MSTEEKTIEINKYLNIFKVQQYLKCRRSERKVLQSSHERRAHCLQQRKT